MILLAIKSTVQFIFILDYNFNSCNGTFTECQEALDLTPTGQPASNINLLELCNQMEKKCLISKQAKGKILYKKD